MTTITRNHTQYVKFRLARTGLYCTLRTREEKTPIVRSKARCNEQISLLIQAPAEVRTRSLLTLPSSPPPDIVRTVLQISGRTAGASVCAARHGPSFPRPFETSWPFCPPPPLAHPGLSAKASSGTASSTKICTRCRKLGPTLIPTCLLCLLLRLLLRLFSLLVVVNGQDGKSPRPPPKTPTSASWNN